MTYEEMVERLKAIRSDYGGDMKRYQNTIMFEGYKKDAEALDKAIFYLSNLRQRFQSTDAISRQAAINNAYNICLDGEVFEVVQVETLIGLPPAEPERKMGKWINSYPDIEPNPMFMYGICSLCGFEQSISDKLNFCPNCGAYMRGGKQE